MRRVCEGSQLLCLYVYVYAYYSIYMYAYRYTCGGSARGSVSKARRCACTYITVLGLREAYSYDAAQARSLQLLRRLREVIVELGEDDGLRLRPLPPLIPFMPRHVHHGHNVLRRVRAHA